MDEQQRDDEREALDALLHSAGWALVKGYIERNWGPKAYRERCRHELKQVARSANPEILADLSIQQVEAVTTAMELLEAWPRDRAATLEQQRKDQERIAAHRLRRRFRRGATPND